jgi:hypothetical protein
MLKMVVCQYVNCNGLNIVPAITKAAAWFYVSFGFLRTKHLMHRQHVIVKSKCKIKAIQKHAEEACVSSEVRILSTYKK